MRIKDIGNGMKQFYCVACNKHHAIFSQGEDGWVFNEDYEKPTITPSIRVQWTKYEVDKNEVVIHDSVKQVNCHSFITDGYIRYEPDSTHELAGQTVELPEIN